MKNNLRNPMLIFLVIFLNCCFSFAVQAEDGANRANQYITCTEIASDGTLNIGHIKKATGFNCFSFNAKAGQNYIMDIFDLNTLVEIEIRLYNPEGDVEAIYKIDNVAHLTHKVKFTGTYHVIVKHQRATTIGYYNFSILSTF